MMRLMRSLAWVAVGLFSGSCGNGVGTAGDLVGGPCEVDRDCAADSRCLTGDDFPKGTCTLPCAIQRNCPDGSACVREDGDFCLLSCQVNDDCRADYRCRGVERAEKDGDALVCID